MKLYVQDEDGGLHLVTANLQTFDLDLGLLLLRAGL